MRLIDADRLLSERMKSTYYHLPNGDIAIPLIDIEHAPTIEERKTGKWIEFPNHYAYKCSECGRIIETVDGKSNVCKHYPYCHCGAKMEEGEQP
jgi:DNA-directed RNA polymerase subunit RPC12/RpoP